MNKEIYHEGWLIKSPPTKRIWRARWRRRWFTLKQGEIPGQFCLEYYTDRNCRKLKGVIDLDQCEQVDSGLRLEHRKQKFQFMFDIKTPRRTYYLAADTESDMRDWVNCICQVCNLHDFTKQAGEQQYYNLSEDNASNMPETEDITIQNQTESLVISDSIIESESIRHSNHSNNLPRPDDIPHGENIYQNDYSSYVNTERSIRENSSYETRHQQQTEQIVVDDNSFKSAMDSKDSENSENCPSYLNQTCTSQQSLTKIPLCNNEQSTIKTITNSSGVIKRIPENLVLNDTIVEDSVEPSPALSTCSGPYIPISECFSGSPKFLNDGTPPTPLNNLDPKFYDTPRSHNNIGLNLTNDQSYSPKIYNCPQQHLRPRSGRSSPTDSESVFTDDEEWSHPMPLRESLDRNTRPSDSSIENEAIVFTYTQRFSKIPDENKTNNSIGDISEIPEETDKLGKRENHLILQKASDDEKNRDIHQLSDTENTSPAIGPKESSSYVEENYDIPRSHQLPYYNMNQLLSKSVSPSHITKSTINSSTPNLSSDGELATSTSTPNTKTLPTPHFYTNAAPTKIEGNVFRYDFIEQGEPPAVNRSLKPKLILEDKPSMTFGGIPSSEIIVPKRPPSIDRNLKPAAFKQQSNNSLRRRAVPLSLVLPNDTDFTINRKDLETRTLPRNNSSSSSSSSNIISGTNMRKSNPVAQFTKSNSQLQYFDLDVANPPPQINRTIYANSSTNISHKLNSSIDSSSSRTSPKSSVVYNSVDFLKTEAFKRIREDAEKNRMKD